jgi:hypothetical protein
MAEFHSICTSFTEMFAANDWKTFQSCFVFRLHFKKYPNPRLYSKVWPMLSIFDSNKQKTPLEISVVFDRWGAVL